MRRTLGLAVVAAFAGLAFATPAAAVPSPTTTNLAETDAAGVIQIGRDRNWRNRNYDRRYRGHYGMGMGTGLITDTIIGLTPTTGRTPTTDIPIGTGDPGSASGLHSDALC